MAVAGLPIRSEGSARALAHLLTDRDEGCARAPDAVVVRHHGGRKLAGPFR
jgi:hypothetical protein